MTEFGNILLYIIGGAICISLVWVASFVLAPRRPNPEKLTTYECGEEVIGNGNIQFNVRFYIIGLIFLIFDVEILFLFPWATIFAEKKLLAVTSSWGIFSFVEMMIFVAILLVGLAYAWVNGDLAWTTPKPMESPRINPVPDEVYAKVNERYA